MVFKHKYMHNFIIRQHIRTDTGCLQNDTLHKSYKNLVKSQNGYTFATGEMAEWSIAAVLKTVELRGSGGSNPSLSAET